MSEPKRYWMDNQNDSDFPYECTDGDWVKYADYARLKAEVDALKLGSLLTAVDVLQFINLKAEVERLRKAGDAMEDAIIDGGLNALNKARDAWNAAKEGKPSV